MTMRNQRQRAAAWASSKSRSTVSVTAGVMTSRIRAWGRSSGGRMRGQVPEREQTGQSHERVMRMRAVVFAAEGELTVADRPEPVPGPREVLIETAAVGICGTDTHVLDGEFEG